MTETFGALKTFLDGFIAVPPMEWLHIASSLRIKTLKKGEFFFKQGEPVTEVGFVAKGLLHNFYLDTQGTQHVKYFIPEGKLVACYSSLILGRPATYSSAALENCVLFTLPYPKTRELYQRHACWERIGRLTAERLYLEKEQREFHFLTSDAKTRYEQFVMENPSLLERVPQYLIASYIGISPVSLSRIRAGNNSSSVS